MMRSMAFSDVKKFFLRWRKELVGSAVLVGLASAVLFILSQLGQVAFVQGKVTPVQIITALFVLVGLSLTWRRVRAVEEGQITERFTRAVDQLGQESKDKMAIRLGGIYALERIAKDSAKDHGPVMEVLTAYVREKAPSPEREIDTPEEEEKPPPTDIQAILTVIGRRETTGNDTPLNLTRTRLVGAYLSDANLSGARLSWAKLNWAYLSDANLSDAHLIRANLSDAHLIRANLSGAKLGRANLKFTDLSGATNLTAKQVRSTENWREAILPDYLNYLKDTPEPSA